MRVKGNTEVWTVSVKVLELIYLKLNLKWPKINILKIDWLCYNREGVVLTIILYVAEFLFQLLKNK